MDNQDLVTGENYEYLQALIDLYLFFAPFLSKTDVVMFIRTAYLMGRDESAKESENLPSERNENNDIWVSKVLDKLNTILEE